MSQTHVTHLHPADDEPRDLIAEVVALQARDSNLTQAEIARQSGVGASRLNQWLRGAYAGDRGKLETEIIRWIDSYQQRQLESKALPAAPSWITTPSSERVLAALSYAQVAADIVLIYGGAGLGKTSATREYARINPQVHVATMSPAAAGVVPALEEVAESLGIKASGGAARIHRAVIRALSGSYGLLIVDEAQHLNTQALDQMRSIHDTAGVGVALVGNEQVYTAMTGGTRAAYLDRLYSRVGKRVHLAHATKGDVDALIAAWEFRGSGCRQLLHDIAAKPGGLRGLTKCLRLASMFAAGRDEAPNCDDIKAAWRDLGGA